MRLFLLNTFVYKRRNNSIIENTAKDIVIELIKISGFELI